MLLIFVLCAPQARYYRLVENYSHACTGIVEWVYSVVALDAHVRMLSLNQERRRSVWSCLAGHPPQTVEGGEDRQRWAGNPWIAVPPHYCQQRSHALRNIFPPGAVLSAKSRSDQQLDEARLKARTIIHAFHKAQDKLDALEVCHWAPQQ